MEHADTPPDVRSSSVWTTSQVRRLVVLWNERASAKRIARILGPEFTRSAVVGKLFRMGLRRTDEQRSEAQSVGGRRSQARLRPPSLPPMPLPPPAPCAVVPRLIGILELRRSSCRWPYGVGEETRFCGHPASAGSYCLAHRAIAYGESLPPLTLEALGAIGRAAPARPHR